MLHSCHDTKPGESVIVHSAAGGVGITTVQIAKAADARVIGTRTNLRWSNDIAQMAMIVRDGVKAGALGVSTCAYSGASHARESSCVPWTFAGVDEMLGVGLALAEAGHVVSRSSRTSPPRC